MKYIERFPKPLLEDIVRNKCIPIIGKNMPMWDKLADLLAEDLVGYPKSSPIDLISAYSHEFTRSKLIEKLNELLLIDSAKPGKTHIAFSNCQFDIVVTTNFDFLLEKGYEKVEKYCQPIVEEGQLSISKKEPLITLLKLHGDLNHPTRLVATEEDYDLFLEKSPLFATYLANLLITRTPLLIGYSLDDPDFRQIWQVINDRLGNLRRPAYVITVGARPSDVARFERRGIKVIDFQDDIKNYPLILESLFNEIREYWSAQFPNVSTIIEERSLADLSLPIDATTRLCFFSVPRDMISFYRTYIFPLVINSGLLPITIEDFISPGESITAKMTAILSRAEVVIADIDYNKWVFYELSKIKHKNHVLLLGKVVKQQIDIPYIESNWDYILLPEKNIWDSEELINNIDRWLKTVQEVLNPQYLEEPQRLFQKHEYRAAVISAVALLESMLRQYLQYSDIREMKTMRGFREYRPASLITMIKLLIQNELIQKNEYEKLQKWVHLRNLAVHEGYQIERKESKEVVDGVSKLLKSIELYLKEAATGKDENVTDV
jgi:uncharacterized protein YutE (UPF0331/DUF86 family)